MSEIIRDHNVIEHHFNSEFLIINILRKIYIIDILLMVNFYPRIGDPFFYGIFQSNMINVI